MKRFIGFSLLIIVTSLSWYSCSKQTEYIPVQDDIKQMTIQSIWTESIGQDNNEVFRIKLAPLIKGKANLHPPRYIVFDGIPLSDDGSGFDDVAGDFIYTSINTKVKTPGKAQLEFLYINDKISDGSAKYSSGGPKVSVKCEGFCFVFYGETCCGQKCEKGSIFGGKAYVCIGGCGCSGSFSWE